MHFYLLRPENYDEFRHFPARPNSQLQRTPMTLIDAPKSGMQPSDGRTSVRAIYRDLGKRNSIESGLNTVGADGADMADKVGPDAPQPWSNSYMWQQQQYHQAMAQRNQQQQQMRPPSRAQSEFGGERDNSNDSSDSRK